MSTPTITRDPRAARTARPRPDATALRAGTIDLPGTARPPHPGGRPCGGLCVPACAR